MVRTALVLSLLGAPLAAEAGPGGLTGMIGLGVSSQDAGVGYTKVGATLDGLVAYRVTTHLALGLRASIGTSFQINEVNPGGGESDTSYYDYADTPIDLAVTALYQDRRLWIAPWIGEHFTFVSETDSGFITGESQAYSGSYLNTDFLMLGLTAGVDIYRFDGSAVGIYADYRHGVGLDPMGFDDVIGNGGYSNWSALTVGVALHRL